MAESPAARAMRLVAPEDHRPAGPSPHPPSWISVGWSGYRYAGEWRSAQPASAPAQAPMHRLRQDPAAFGPDRELVDDPAWGHGLFTSSVWVDAAPRPRVGITHSIPEGCGMASGRAHNSFVILSVAKNPTRSGVRSQPVFMYARDPVVIPSGVNGPLPLLALTGSAPDQQATPSARCGKTHTRPQNTRSLTAGHCSVIPRRRSG
jgi:hypothetical protein